MKKTALFKLLQERTIVHPTIITSATLSSNDNLTLYIEGFPWWRAVAGDDHNGKSEFIFSGIEAGCLDVTTLTDGDFEALDEFHIYECDDVPWAQNNGFAIYCSQSIPDPFTLYGIAHDWLHTNKSPFEIKDYLNFGNSGLIRDYARICRSDSFLIARAPSELADLLCDELSRSKVAHTKLPERQRNLPQFAISLAGSHFFCRNAVCVHD